MTIRTIAWVAVVSALGCTHDRTRAGDPDATLTSAAPDDNGLREIIARTAAEYAIVDRIADPQLRAIGGGPPALQGSTWPFAARTAVAKAVCDARRSCGVESDGCVERESRRLDTWAIDACEVIDTTACVAAISSSPCAGDWKLPDVCAPSAMCQQPVR
jgi:hypothetical protein